MHICITRLHRAMAAPAMLLAALFVSLGSPAQAQSTNTTPPAANAVPIALTADSSSLDEVVVTGTSIRGVAPVGSNLITLGREQIDQTGAQTIQQILRDVPAITGLAATPQGGNPGNAFYSPTIHGIGSSSSNATLVLVDGHRISPGSQQQTLTDPNIIPPIMLERVEVLAEGASSTYGSDAVAGVINFITRKTFDGLLVTGQGGIGDNYHDETAGALWGTHWEESSLMIGYNYSYRGDLAYSARSYLERNHTAEGGTNFDTFFCNPASIQPAGSALIYVSPTSVSGVKNTAATAPCQNQIAGDILPAEERNNAMLKFTKAFGADLDIGLDVVVSSVKNNTPTARGTLTATVYGPGSTPPGGAGEINPFYTDPPGVTATTQSVRFDSDALLGRGGANSYNNNNDYYVSGTFEYRLPHDFRVSGLSLFGGEDSYVGNTGELCVSCAYLALNGTTNGSGNPAQNAVLGSGATTLITQLPLTASNALDVWNPVNANRTSPAVLAALTNNVTNSRWYYSIQQERLGLDGPLFTLPGGPLKVAAGFEYVHYGLDVDKTFPNSAGPASLESETFLMNVGRRVASAYGEALIPVVGENNMLPFVRRIDLSVSGRYDDYVGLYTTKNPHLGLGWESLPGIVLRANYSTSFVAPQLSSVGIMSANDLTTYSGYSASNQALNNVPLASFPLAAMVPGATCTATACNIGSNVNGISVNGNKPGLQPGRGQSWSVGFDLAPQFLPHLHSNFALFNVNLINQVSGSSASNDINSAALHNNLTFFPTGATAAQIAQYTYGYPQLSAIAPTIYYVLSVRGQNLLNLYVQGVDADVRYDIPTAVAGTFRIDGAMTYFTKFNQNIAGGPTFSVLNTTGYNNTFPSIQLQGRGNLGWDYAPFSTDMFVNFVGEYTNWSSTAVNPLVIRNGFPSGSGGDEVSPTITLDLHAAYNFGGTSGSRVDSSQVYVDVTNLLNSPPAFYNSANGYDSYAGNILGRIVSLGFRVKL